MSVRYFLSFMDYNPEGLIGLIRRSSELEDLYNRGVLYEPLENQILGIILEKASTRTRLFFEAGMIQLGDQTIFPSPRDTQLGRGGPVGDGARVMSRMFDGMMIRIFAHAALTEFAAHSKVSVINDLSNGLHPCQLLTDMQTFHEYRDSIQGKTVIWTGNGNNTCSNYTEAALEFDFQLHVACPEDYESKAEFVAFTGNRLRAVRGPHKTVAGAYLVSTNVWALMGREDETAVHIVLFRPRQVNVALLDGVIGDVLSIHCLPAHRGEEIGEELLDNPHSIVWDQAEDRLHMQKALPELLIEHAYYA